MWLAVFFHLYVRTGDVSVSADDLFVVWVPYNELLLRDFHCIKVIYVHGHSASAARVSECFFTKPSYLPHDVRGIVVVDDVYLVTTLVRIPQLLGRGQPGLDYIRADR